MHAQHQTAVHLEEPPSVGSVTGKGFEILDHERNRRIMRVPYSRISTASVLLVCLIATCPLASLGPAKFHAAAGDDRLGEMIMATGPVMVRYDHATKAPFRSTPSISSTTKAVACWRLCQPSANRPAPRRSSNHSQSDLAADFKLDVDRGPRPHFLMTTGSLGPYTAGWAPLYVIETASNQIGVYRLHLQATTGQAGRPKFELLQMKSYANSTVAKLADERGDSQHTGQTTMTTGPIRVSSDEATKASIPFDALYILDYDGDRGARLVASLPTFRQAAKSTTIIESFVEARLGCRLQARARPRPASAFPHDHGIARPVHGGVGSAFCDRIDDQPDRGLPAPGFVREIWPPEIRTATVTALYPFDSGQTGWRMTAWP